MFRVTTKQTNIVLLMSAIGLTVLGFIRIRDTPKVNFTLNLSSFGASEDKSSSRTNISLCSTNQRQAYTRDMCARLKLDKINKPRFLVDHERKIAYCEIPKIASTTWRTIMVNETGRCPIITRDMDMKRRIPEDGFIRCAQLKYERYTDTLKTYTKFVVLRHPLDRLLSAYHDKAFIHNTKDGRVVIYNKFESLVQFSMEKQHIKGPFTSEEIKSHYVPFDHFVEYMMHHGDSYWTSYAKKCGLCHMDYDVIMRTESLGPDSATFLHKYYPKTSELPVFHQLQKVKSSQHAVKQKTLREFETINGTLMTAIMKKYRLDLEMYGYHFDQDSNTAFCDMHFPDGDVCC